MIVAEQKPLNEIKSMLKGCKKVLAVGCGTCVTVCFAGGRQEVGVLSASLRMSTDLDGEAVNIDKPSSSASAKKSITTHWKPTSNSTMRFCHWVVVSVCSRWPSSSRVNAFYRHSTPNSWAIRPNTASGKNAARVAAIVCCI